MNSLLRSIAGKLAVLAGGAVAVSGAGASTVPTSVPNNEFGTFSQSGPVVRTSMPAKLILKQRSGGFQMIASHDSHSSHASHASHSSHSSSAY